LALKNADSKLRAVDSLFGIKIPRQHFRRERVEQVFLNRAFERSGGELRVEAWDFQAKALLDLSCVSARLPS